MACDVGQIAVDFTILKQRIFCCIGFFLSNLLSSPCDAGSFCNPMNTPYKAGSVPPPVLQILQKVRTHDVLLQKTSTVFASQVCTGYVMARIA